MAESNAALNDDKPRLLLHIGGAKCGSTAIQGYLNVNRHTLGEHKVLSLGRDFDPSSNKYGSQVQYFESIRTEPNRADLAYDRLKSIRDHMHHLGHHTLIISAENLCNFRLGHVESIKRTPELFECEVFLYARRQDHFIESGWKQWGFKAHDDIGGYMRECIRDQICDWFAVLEAYRHVFSIENLKLAIFDRSKLFQGDVVKDFANRASIDFEECQYTNQDYQNNSLSGDLVRLAGRVRETLGGRNENQFKPLMIELLGDAALSRKDEEPLLTDHQCREITKAHAESNRQLSDTYNDGKELFSTATKAATPADEIEQLKRETGLLFALMYQIAKNQRGGE